jgi:hypothetical protein
MYAEADHETDLTNCSRNEGPNEISSSAETFLFTRVDRVQIFKDAVLNASVNSRTRDVMMRMENVDSNLVFLDYEIEMLSVSRQASEFQL